MHAHIQSSIGAALANATMEILLPAADYNTSLSTIHPSYQISDSAIALALPYSHSNQDFPLRALLTRHPQCSRAVNIMVLLVVLTWALWEKIVEGVRMVDEWLVEETNKEEQRVWRNSYWGRRRGWVPRPILKRRDSEETVGSSGDEEGEKEWSQIGNKRRRGVTFAQDVKAWDGENEDACWDLCGQNITPMDWAVRV